MSEKHDRLLLISSNWQFRALVRAQLIEEGYDVVAFPRLDVALTYLVRGSGATGGGQQSGAAIVDLTRLGADVKMLIDLWRLTGKTPLLLCGGMLERPLLEAEGLPPARILIRPFSVGDVIGEVRRIDTWPGAEGRNL